MQPSHHKLSYVISWVRTVLFQIQPIIWLPVGVRNEQVEITSDCGCDSSRRYMRLLLYGADFEIACAIKVIGFGCHSSFSRLCDGHCRNCNLPSDCKISIRNDYDFIFGKYHRLLGNTRGGAADDQKAKLGNLRS